MAVVTFLFLLLMVSVLYTAKLLAALHTVPVIAILLATIINIAIMITALYFLEKWGMVK